MAGLFERMGLVRTEYEGMPEIPMQPVSEPMYAPETPVIDATQVSYDDVIASIYQQGDIDDENSIFESVCGRAILRPEEPQQAIWRTEGRCLRY